MHGSLPWTRAETLHFGPASFSWDDVGRSKYSMYVCGKTQSTLHFTIYKNHYPPTPPPPPSSIRLNLYHSRLNPVKIIKILFLIQLEARVYNSYFLYTDQYLTIFEQTMQCILVTGLVVVSVSLLLLPDSLAAACAVLSIMSTLLVQYLRTKCFFFLSAKMDAQIFRFSTKNFRIFIERNLFILLNSQIFSHYFSSQNLHIKSKQKIGKKHGDSCPYHL